uniref:Uncharacterized protein n=1 Tax=Arundo donax TaxID=35708 RepID=A0A0A9C9W6_ARUDO
MLMSDLSSITAQSSDLWPILVQF